MVDTPSSATAARTRKIGIVISSSSDAKSGLLVFEQIKNSISAPMQSDLLSQRHAGITLQIFVLGRTTISYPYARTKSAKKIFRGRFE
jgi:hypothetical protein